MLDYVLMKTGQDQLIYLGHSQGVTSAFVMLSERPEYNEKISLLVFELHCTRTFNQENLHQIFNILQHAMTPPIILKHYSPYAPSAIKDINHLEGWAVRTNNVELFRYEDHIKIVQFYGELCTVSVFKSFCKYLNDILPGPASPKSYYDVMSEIHF